MDSNTVNPPNTPCIRCGETGNVEHDNPTAFCNLCVDAIQGGAEKQFHPNERSQYLTFGVLAGAYLNHAKDTTFLTHVCEVDDDGYPRKTLCNRVKPEHICPDGYTAEELAGPATCPACAKKDPRHLTRERKEVLIWRHTSKDYRGVVGGEKTILVLRLGGTTLVPLSGLTDAELADSLKYAQHAEAKRLAKKAAK